MPSGLQLRKGLTLAITAAVLIYYALRGGSYDIVVRQEEALTIWWIIGIGLLVGLLPARRLPRYAWIPLLGLALLAAWTAISLTWTESDERTLAEVTRVTHYLGLVLLIWMTVTRDTWRAAAAGIATAAALVTTYALCTRLFPGVFPADRVRIALRLDRLSLPFNYWNALAAWGAMSIAMLLVWSAHAQRVATRAAALGAVPVCGLTVFLTYSRAGLAGVALGIIAAVALGRNRWVSAAHALSGGLGTAIAILVARSEPAIANGTGGKGAAWVVAALVGAIALAAVAVIATSGANGDRQWRLTPRAARVALIAGLAFALVSGALAGPGLAADAWDQFKEAKPSIGRSDPAARLGNLQGTRYLLWRSALDAFEADGLRGIGAGSFEFWWSRHLDRYSFERDAHSLYLEQLGELGIPGLLLTLLALGSLLAVALVIRARGPSDRTGGIRAALVVPLIVFLLNAGVDWMWETTAVTVLALAGVAVAAAGRDGPHARLERSKRWRIPAAVLAIALALLQLPGLVSTSLVRDSQAKFRSGETAPAQAAASDAVDAQPWAASPYVQAALVEESRGDLSEAATKLRRAMRREPTNWRHPLLLARVESERGHVAGALAAFRRARQLRPLSQFFGSS